MDTSAAAGAGRDPPGRDEAAAGGGADRRVASMEGGDNEGAAEKRRNRGEAGKGEDTKTEDLKSGDPKRGDTRTEEGREGGLDRREQKDAEEGARLSALTIYEILRREGEDEMDRPATSLWWSGVAAGLSISLSLLAQGVLQSHLPDAPWRPLIVGFGYAIGFVIVVMARHQLFTENTITVVLPVTAHPSLQKLGRMGRLWGLVLVANLVGTFASALFCSFTSVVEPSLRDAMLTLSQEAMAHTPLEIFYKAIVAGFVIAAMVWLLPSAGAMQLLVIVMMTWLIAIAGLAHSVAGSFEGFMMVVNGRAGLWSMVADFELPALAGNIVGGTALFSLIAYGQVAKEM